MDVLGIGSGVSGLTTGLCLLEAGYQVQMWSRKWPLHTTRKEERMNFADSRETAERISAMKEQLHVPGRGPWLHVRSETLAGRMDQSAVPGISLAVINHGCIARAKSYGVVDTMTQQPVTRAMKRSARCSTTLLIS